MKKGDIIIILLVLLLAGSAFGIYSAFFGGAGAEVVVYVDGEETGRYPLYEDCTVKINDGTNMLVIEDGSAHMEEAKCPDQVCVRHKKISKNGENIICLPNKVVVSVEGGEETEADAVVQ